MYFFFSYSRQNNDSFLRDFFNDLNTAVKELVGEKNDAGFFDQKGLEPGELWESELEQALSQARVFIAAVTAGYVKSEYCGKEWAAFEARLSAYATAKNVVAPPLILPVYWHPSEEPLPESIGQRQYKFGDPKEIYNQKGLKYVYRLKQRFEMEQTNFVDALAAKIVSLYKQFGNFDQQPTVPKLADLASPFTHTAQTAAPGVPAVEAKGPKRVRFVFGAAKPGEITGAGKKNIQPYGAGGGEEWQPYFPGAKKIGSIARQTAALDELNLWSEQLDITQQLPIQIRDAENQRELVIMFIDSWTAGLPQYQAILQSFDQQNYLNCSVIVPWNENDPDNQQNNQQLLGALNATFQYRTRNQNDLYYRPLIKNEDELRKQLVDVLVRLRAEIINKSSPPQGNLPTNGGTRPLIEGPGS